MDPVVGFWLKFGQIPLRKSLKFGAHNGKKCKRERVS